MSDNRVLISFSEYWEKGFSSTIQRLKDLNPLNPVPFFLRFFGELTEVKGYRCSSVSLRGWFFR